MEEYINKLVAVVTQDGRYIVGTLKGIDASTNVVLAQSHERVFSLTDGVESHPLGLYLIRGDNLALLGPLDEEEDAMTDLKELRAAPLNPVVY